MTTSVRGHAPKWSAQALAPEYYWRNLYHVFVSVEDSDRRTWYWEMNSRGAFDPISARKGKHWFDRTTDQRMYKRLEEEKRRAHKEIPTHVRDQDGDQQVT